MAIPDYQTIVLPLLKFAGDSRDADKLRKTYALEMMHLIDTYLEITPRESL